MKQIIHLLFLTILISCTDVQETNTFEADQVEKEVRAMFDQYHAAIEQSGLTGEFDYLDTSDDFFWVPPGYESALNYDSVRAILEGNAPMFQSVSFHFDTLQVFSLTSTLANYTGIVSGEMTDTAGANSTVRIIESGTAIKRKSGWKLLCGQSAALPAKQEN